MNYKLEKFWNQLDTEERVAGLIMNYKLEKFWNIDVFWKYFYPKWWTINLKSFEIDRMLEAQKQEADMN